MNKCSHLRTKDVRIVWPWQRYALCSAESHSSVYSFGHHSYLKQSDDQTGVKLTLRTAKQKRNWLPNITSITFLRLTLRFNFEPPSLQLLCALFLSRSELQWECRASHSLCHVKACLQTVWSADASYPALFPALSKWCIARVHYYSDDVYVIWRAKSYHCAACTAQLADLQSGSLGVL